MLYTLMMENEIPFFDSKYSIYEGNYWNIILNNDQHYLGKSIVYLKSRVLENPLQLTKEERDELWESVLPKLESALKKAFQADRLNYSHLANAAHFVHWHIVPRYEKNPIREFAGETFKDENVGSHYAPAPTKKVSPEVMGKILLEIKKNI